MTESQEAPSNVTDISTAKKEGVGSDQKEHIPILYEVEIDKVTYLLSLKEMGDKFALGIDMSFNRRVRCPITGQMRLSTPVEQEARRKLRSERYVNT